MMRIEIDHVTGAIVAPRWAAFRAFTYDPWEDTPHLDFPHPVMHNIDHDRVRRLCNWLRDHGNEQKTPLFFLIGSVVTTDDRWGGWQGTLILDVKNDLAVLFKLRWG